MPYAYTALADEHLSVHKELADVLKMHDDLLAMFENDEAFWRRKFMEYLHKQYDLKVPLNSKIVGWKSKYDSLEFSKPRIFVWGYVFNCTAGGISVY